MSLSEILEACDAEVPASYRDDLQGEVKLCQPDEHISVSCSRGGGPDASTPSEYVLDPAVDVTYQPPRKSGALSGVPLDTDDLPLATSQSVPPERVLPHPNRQDTGVLGFGEAKGSEDSPPTEDAHRQDGHTDELSPREKELRRPPSPFALLDVNPTRPELPSRLRVIPVIRVP